MSPPLPPAAWGRDQRGADEHEEEGEHPADDLQRSGADRVAEDEDAADDRDEVGRDRGQGDHLDPGPICRPRAEA